MHFIKSYATEIRESHPYKKIERIGRICYKSEDKITEDSWKQFVHNLINRQHYAMLEHARLFFELKLKDTDDESGIGKCRRIIDDLANIPAIYTHWVGCGDVVHLGISVSMSHLYDPKWHQGEICSANAGILFDAFKFLVEMDYSFEDECEFDVSDMLDLYELDFTDISYITDCNMNDPNILSYDSGNMTFVSVKFDCDRGVSHELVRHRVAVAQSSTRYVSSCSRKSLVEFNLEDETDIEQCYLQGFSTYQIAENSSYTPEQICNILRDRQVKLRGKCMKGYRNENYFDHIDTPHKAYLLGIIQSDGSLNGDTLSITQHSDYVWYIELLLYEFCDHFCKVDEGSCNDLQITSKILARRLRDIGIVTNKSHHQTDEDIDKLWNSIPDQFLCDFIRGLIDGDGHVRYYVQKHGKQRSPSIGFCSTQRHLIELIHQHILDKFDYSCGIYQHHETKTPLYDLIISHRDKSLQIGRYLYQNFSYPFGHPKKCSNWISEFGDPGYDVSEFGDNQFRIVLPSTWSEWSVNSKFLFLKQLYQCEDTYTNLRISGMSPQQCRAILPNSLATEVVLTMNLYQWEHFLDLRCKGTTGSPHPDMKDVAQIAYDNVIKEYFDSWDGYRYYC